MYQWEWEEDIHHNVVFKINFSIENQQFISLLLHFS